MDSKLIYDSNKVICSEPVHIGSIFIKYYLSFFKENLKAPAGRDNVINLQDQIKDCLDSCNKSMTSEQIQNLEERCDINFLASESDQPIINFNIYKARKLYIAQETKLGTELKTIQCLKDFADKADSTDSNIHLTAERYLKYRSNVMIEHEPREQPASYNATAVITIRSYFPYRHDLGIRNTKGLPKFDREFKILGSTKLTEFRDALSCRQDLDTGEEKSLDPNKPTTPENLGAALFYINGVVYIDDRYPYEEGYDYGQSLQKWGHRKGMEIKVYDMGEMCFNDIYVRLGYPNVYQHRGCCEHLFVFSDIECTPPEFMNLVNQFDYPLVTSVYNDCKSYCMICYKYMATWVTLNNLRTMSDEFLWCSRCFTRYNYTTCGKKVGEFSAYKYFS